MHKSLNPAFIDWSYCYDENLKAFKDKQRNLSQSLLDGNFEQIETEPFSEFDFNNSVPSSSVYLYAKAEEISERMSDAYP